MSLNTNFNVNPYYDDFDEDKKFLRLLFKPGYAVQARELTQLQTLLQNQTSRFGNWGQLATYQDWISHKWLPHTFHLHFGSKGPQTLQKKECTKSAGAPFQLQWTLWLVLFFGTPTLSETSWLLFSG
jgi:hypothetical protein